MNKVYESNKNFHYFYKITNLINGKFYYGIRSCDCDPEDDPYMGSGFLLHKAYKKYGIDNFEKAILRLLPTRMDALDLEAWIVTDELVMDPMCYNMVRGGSSILAGLVCIKDPNNPGKNTVISSKEYHKNPERYEVVNKNTCIVRDLKTGECIRISRNDPRWGNPMYPAASKGFHHTDEVRKKISDIQKGSVWINNGTEQRFVRSWAVKTWLDEGWVKGKLDEIHNKGKIAINNGEVNKYVTSEELDSFLGNGWELGCRSSELLGSALGKIFINNVITKEVLLLFPDEASKMMESSENWVYGNGTKGIMTQITDGKSIRRVPIEDLDYYLNLLGPEWRYGSPIKGYVKINNGTNEKMVPENEVQSYINDGWNTGSLTKGNIRMNNGKKDIYARNEEEAQKLESEGWIRGGVHGRTTALKGRKFLYNDAGEIKMAYSEEEAKMYESEGWKRGRPPRNKKKK